MLANLNDYLKDLMVYIPEGEIPTRFSKRAKMD